MSGVDRAVVDRIKKLLNLARDGGATEAEAERAQEFAERMMQEHNLHLAMVEASGEVGAEARGKGAADGRAMYRWQRELMAAIAETNYCHLSTLQRAVRTGQRDRYGVERMRMTPSGYELIGREANLVATTTMFDYLCQTVNRLVLDYVGGDNRQRMTKHGVAFQEGCGDRLRDRIKQRHEDYLRQQRREAEEEMARRAATGGATGTALAVVMEDFAELERMYNEDVRRGVPLGTTRDERDKRRAERDETGRQNKAKMDRLLAEGIAERVAQWMVWMNWDQAEAERYVASQVPKEETEAQRRKREAKEEREWQAYREREWRRQAKRNTAGYRDGQAAGDQVGLDSQVGREQRRSIS